MVPFGQVPKVTIRLVVQAANLHEGKDQVWLADLTGNMMREGTTALTADALAREFAAMGGQLGIGVGPDTDVGFDRGPERSRRQGRAAHRGCRRAAAPAGVGAGARQGEHGA